MTSGGLKEAPSEFLTRRPGRDGRRAASDALRERGIVVGGAVDGLAFVKQPLVSGKGENR